MTQVCINLKIKIKWLRNFKSGGGTLKEEGRGNMFKKIDFLIEIFP